MSNIQSGVSLHIGINQVDPTHYSGWSGPLNACESDAEAMAAIAKQQGFQVTTLRTEKATRAAVIANIAAAAKTLTEGDIFFLTYAGHGGQVPDVNGDEEDSVDETWCLFDGQLIDDELYALWARFAAGVRILVVSDSCHSGTVTRVPEGTAPRTPTAGAEAERLGTVGARARFMPAESAARTYRQNRAFYDAIQSRRSEVAPSVRAAVRLLSGCQDDQVSLDGTFNGLFTGRLLKVWDAGKFQGSYREFHQRISSQMPATQQPNYLAHGASNGSFDRERPFSIF